MRYDITTSKIGAILGSSGSGPLRDALRAQIEEGAERHSVAGRIDGRLTLGSQTLDIVEPVARHLFSWSTDVLLDSLPDGNDAIRSAVRGFLERVYALAEYATRDRRFGS